MRVVFKSEEDFFKKAGDRIKGDEAKKKQVTEEFKEKFSDMLSFMIDSLLITIEYLSKEIYHSYGETIKFGINDVLLKQSLLDAYDDLLRLTDYHPTENPNPLKEMAYICFWLLRRKPIVILDSGEEILIKKECEIPKLKRMHALFINEYCASKLAMNAAFRSRKQVPSCIGKVPEAERQLDIYETFMFYSMIYRIETPKYIEAMLLGCTLHPVWEVDPVIWEEMEKTQRELEEMQ